MPAAAGPGRVKNRRPGAVSAPVRRLMYIHITALESVEMSKIKRPPQGRILTPAAAHVNIINIRKSI
jgi:hypothetical protein